jgi:hypothetical protein
MKTLQNRRKPRKTREIPNRSLSDEKRYKTAEYQYASMVSTLRSVPERCAELFLLAKTNMTRSQNGHQRIIARHNCKAWEHTPRLAMILRIWIALAPTA